MRLRRIACPDCSARGWRVLPHDPCCPVLVSQQAGHAWDVAYYLTHWAERSWHRPAWPFEWAVQGAYGKLAPLVAPPGYRVAQGTRTVVVGGRLFPEPCRLIYPLDPATERIVDPYPLEPQ